MTYSDPIIVSDGPTDPEYEEEEFPEEETHEEEEEIFCFFEEEDEEEIARKKKIRQIIGVLDKLRRLLAELLDE